MLNAFYTIDEQEYTSEIIEKKSRFIALLVNVENEAEAIRIIEKTRKMHREARHNVVRAYSTAAKQAISLAKKIEMKLSNEYEITVDYNFNNILQHYFKTERIHISQISFSEKVSISIIVDTEKSQNITDKIIEKTEGTAKVKLKGTYYHK